MYFSPSTISRANPVHFPRDINSRPVARPVCEPWVWSVVQLVKASGKWHPLLGRQRIAQVPQNREGLDISPLQG